MPYLVVVLQIEESALRETLVAELVGLQYEGFEEFPDLLHAYIDEMHFDHEQLQELLQRYKNYVLIALHKIFLLPEKNWNEVWESSFQPVSIGNSILIRAPFHSLSNDYQHIITVEPKMAFGTGHHETTAMILAEMLQYQWEGASVCDFGCGTGILAIMAALLGASNLVAIDYDQWSVESTIENIALNNITTPTQVRLGSVEQVASDEKFNFILANINRNVLLDSLPLLYRALLPNGLLFMSGILVTDVPVMQKAANDLGLHYKASDTKGNWAMLVFAR